MGQMYGFCTARSITLSPTLRFTVVFNKKKSVNAFLHAANSVLMQHLTPGLFLGHEVYLPELSIWASYAEN